MSIKNFLINFNWKKYAVTIPLTAVALFSISFASINYFSLTKELDQSKRNINQIKQDVRSAIIKKNQLKGYFLQLHKLSQQGYISEPNKLKWLQALQKAADMHQIPQIQFTLYPTVDSKSSESQGSPAESNLLLTPMEINMELMHEGDFYLLLTELRNTTNGIFTAEECDIKRVDKKLTGDNVTLQAKCHLNWINYLDPRKNWESS